MKKILPFFSYLFHPLFIPLFAVIYCYLLDVNFLSTDEKYLILIQVTIITILIPISFYFLLRSLGMADSVMMSELRQRIAPLAMQVLLFAVLLSQTVSRERTAELYFFFLAALISSVIALAFLFCEKRISLHMLGMASLVFLVIGLSFHNQVNIVNTAAFLFVMTGIVASSRLYMEAHDYTELTLGFISGMLPQMVMWGYWL